MRPRVAGHFRTITRTEQPFYYQLQPQQQPPYSPKPNSLYLNERVRASKQAITSYSVAKVLLPFPLYILKPIEINHFRCMFKC